MTRVFAALERNIRSVMVPKQKIFIRPLDFFFVGILFILLVGSLVFFFRSEKIHGPFSYDTNSDVPAPQENQALTFTSYQYGLSFFYPSLWRVSTSMYAFTPKSIDSIVLTDFSEQAESTQTAVFPQDHFVRVELFSRSSAENITQAYHRLFPQTESEKASSQFSLIHVQGREALMVLRDENRATRQLFFPHQKEEYWIGISATSSTPTFSEEFLSAFFVATESIQFF